MKAWFTSLNGAIALSMIALLTFLGRTFLDFQYVMPDFFPSSGQTALGVVVYMALFGGWLWGLLAAVRGSRGGLIALLVFNLLLPFGAGVATLVSWCPSPCPTAWPLMEIANWTNLLLGLLAAVSVGLRLRQSSR